MKNVHVINSGSYWDSRFRENWEECEGPLQSRFFARIAIEHLPKWLVVQIRQQSLTLADWGCAQGDGTAELARYFSPKQIVGVDFSRVAIEQATRRYPEIRFLDEDWLGEASKGREDFDIIFSSNTLEHFHEPFCPLGTICSRAKKAIVLALPYREKDRIEEHFFSFFPENIPIRLPNGFRLVWAKVIDCRAIVNSYWGGEQIILLFANPEWADQFCTTLSDLLIQSDDAETLKKLHDNDIEARDGRISALADQIDRKNEEYIAVLNERDSEISSLKNEISSRQIDIVALQKKIADLSNDLQKLECQNQRHVDNYLLLKKQLMQMSDWANDLNGRVKIIDNTTILRSFERLNFYIHHKKYKYLVKNLVKQILPSSALLYLKYLASSGLKREIFSSLSKSDGRLVICFPIITWHSRWQRPQHMITELSRRGFSIIYLAMGLTPHGSLYNDIWEAYNHISSSKLGDGIFKIWLSSKDKIDLYTDSLEGDDFLNVIYGIMATIESLSPRKIYYLVQFPGWSEVAFRLKEKYGGKVVFDCMDDHSGFSTNSIDSIKKEHELLSQSDLVVASSDLLYSKARNSNENVVLVNNGTQVDHFAKLEPNGQFDRLKCKPIIGYYGAISDWFDIDLIQYCAKSRPEYTFILIGSCVGCNIDVVSGLDNVIMVGEVPYKSLPGYLYYFDVCLIPFKILPLTLATNPVKFFEYISSGKPVVSVELPELMPYKDLCYLAKDAESFLNSIDAALTENDQSVIKRRKELAVRSSWENRANLFIEAIQGLPYEN